MKDQQETKRILITVMTYPHPSRGHQELVCTAGVTDTGKWVRLYPIDYRYRPGNQRFRKYQWIEAKLAPAGHGNDNRKESRRPDLEALKLLGDPLGTANNWRERRIIIDRLPIRTLRELKDSYDTDQISLGIVRPTKVLDLTIEPISREWKPQWQTLLNQLNLFEAPPKPLKKIPFKFSYVFECDDSTRPHRAMIEDWELGVLFLKELDRLGDEQKAAASVRHKFFGEMCGADRDTRFFMGTTFPYNSWVVVGVFWPQRLKQMELDLNALS